MRKRALVLSGGGSKGAYEVGAINCLMGVRQRRYDIFAGVSVGAINAAFLSQYKDDDVDIHLLNTLWQKRLTTKAVWKRWFPFGRVHGLWKSSLYNSKPLRKLITANYSPDATKASGKILRMGAVNLADGKYRIFRETDDNLLEGVLASSAFPAFLTPAIIEGSQWIDGGLRNVTPLKAAIDAGADEIDIVMTSPPGVVEKLGKLTALGIAFRSIDIMSSEIIENDIRMVGCVNLLVHTQCVDRRHIDLNIIRPKKPLGVHSLKFNQVDTNRLIVQGYEDAAEVLSG